MKKYIIVILLILNFLLSFAQTKPNVRHFDKQVTFAKELLLIGDYKAAYTNFLELYQVDSTNTEVNYYLGYSSFHANRNKLIALPYLIKGTSFNGNAYYFIGLIYHQQEKFNLAHEAYNNYKSLAVQNKTVKISDVNTQIYKIKTARKFMKYHENITVENLGKEINSAYPDYGPVLFANGNKLYFTSRRQGSFSEFKDPNNEYFEDVYYCEKVNDKWEKPSNIGLPINTKTHDAMVAISEDEKSLYIYRTNASIVGGDIFVSQKAGDNWGEVKVFDSSINTKSGSESSISIHPDGTKIYFSSNREGGYGGKDIYCVKKLPNGKWSLPTNLGGMINTEEDEDGPFISSDGVTLYFASRGHKNMGGYDLFKTKLQENKQWQEPRNMGYPINSVMDDIFISTVNNEDYFFSSNRAGGYGFSDIYHSILPKTKNEYIVIKGRVLDNNTQASLRASITLFNKDNNRLEGVYKSDSEAGKFIMVVKPGEQYKMFIEVKGYYNQTLQIDLTKSLSIEDILKTVRMTKKQLKVEHE